VLGRRLGVPAGPPGLLGGLHPPPLPGHAAALNGLGGDPGGAHAGEEVYLPSDINLEEAR
jgi:hypothetical protein